MGKYTRKKEKKSRKGFVILLILALIVALALFIMPQVLYKLNGAEDVGIAAEDQTQAAQASTQAYSEAVTFPIVLDDGKIEIESLFQFEGVNPDAGKQETQDAAAIVLKNVSDQYLSSAAVTAELNDGTQVRFAVTELPAGASVIAFDIDNKSLSTTAVCVDMSAETVYADVPNNDGLEIFAAGMMITLKNASSADLNDIDVYYRDVFDDKYFGGMTYIYNIEHLSAGESITVTAEDSLLGVIDVVRTVVNE